MSNHWRNSSAPTSAAISRWNSPKIFSSGKANGTFRLGGAFRIILQFGTNGLYVQTELSLISSVLKPRHYFPLTKNAGEDMPYIFYLPLKKAFQNTSGRVRQKLVVIPGGWPA